MRVCTCIKWALHTSACKRDACSCLISSIVCVCVCVCEAEREIEVERQTKERRETRIEGNKRREETKHDVPGKSKMFR